MISVYIHILVYIIISITSIKVYKTYKNPCLIMNGVWMICVFFSRLRLYDLYPVSNSTYTLIFLFIIIYSVVCMLMHYILYANVKINNVDTEMQQDNNNIWLIIWLGIGLIVVIMFKPLSNNIKYLLAGTIRMAHNEWFKYHGGMTFIQYFAFGYIFLPFLKAVIIISLYYVINVNKNKKMPLLLGLLCTVITLIINGGRSSVFEYMIYLTLVWLFRTNNPHFSNNNINKEKSKLRNSLFLIGGIILGITILSYMTKDSASFENRVLTTFYVYLVGGISYLDIILKNKSKFGIYAGKYLYGKGTFGIISIPFSIISRLLAGTDYYGADRMAAQYTELFFLISPRIRYNAACTIIYTFLRDWGDAGIIIGTVIYGIFVSIVYYLYTKKRNMRWTCIWLYVAYSIFFSFWRYNLAQSTVFTFMWLYILTSKTWNKRKIKVKINKPRI